jgi:short subunit dehydrogenase-like uncharacterized protein
MDRMFVLYDRAAKDAGVLVVPACGFDCVPNDVGVEYTRQQFPDPRLVSVCVSLARACRGVSGTDWGWGNGAHSVHRELLHHVRHKERQRERESERLTDGLCVHKGPCIVCRVCICQ